MNTKNNSDIPKFTLEQLEYLKKLYPLSDALRLKTEAELHKFQGIQSVIQSIKGLT